MRSPFPGMDPYLEQFWGDVHHTMITARVLRSRSSCPPILSHASMNELFVEPSDGIRRKIIPDVRVVERGRREEPVIRASNGIAVAEPLVVHMVAGRTGAARLHRDSSTSSQAGASSP